MKIKTHSFADLFAETSPQLGGARRTKFLETLDRIIPWQDLKSLIEPYYSEGKRGAQPYSLELMIRIHFFSWSITCRIQCVKRHLTTLSHVAALSV